MTELAARSRFVTRAAMVMLPVVGQCGSAGRAESVDSARELFARAQQSYNRISAYECEVTSFAC